MNIPDLDLITCATCSKTYRYPQERRGGKAKAVRCGACKSLIEVPPKIEELPASEAVEPAPPPAPPAAADSQPAPPAPEPELKPETGSEPPAESSQPAAPDPAASAESTGERLVLIAEPDEVRAELLGEAAALVQAESQRVTTLADAFVFIQERKPQLLITTVVLDDGICQDLISQAREMDGDLKIVLAGSIFRSYRYRSSPTTYYGADNYFEGPTTKEELQALFLDTIPAWRGTAAAPAPAPAPAALEPTPPAAEAAAETPEPDAPGPGPELPEPKSVDLGPIRPPKPSAESDDVDLWGDEEEAGGDSGPALDVPPPAEAPASVADQPPAEEPAPPAEASGASPAMPAGNDGPDRLARVVLSDLLLYHRDVVKPGMTFDEFETELKEPLEEARSYLEHRYPGKGEVLNTAIHYFLDHPEEFDIGSGGTP